MLKIYQFPACPFCQIVLRETRKLGLEEGSDFELISASRGTPGRDEVVEKGGRSQVPFLVDEEVGVQMYESADIVEYLRRKFAPVS